MAKKASRSKEITPPVVDNTDAKKPPELEEARESVHLAAFCWAGFLQPSEETMSYDKWFELLQGHVRILHNIELYWLNLRYSEQYTGPISDGPFRPYDQVLDLPTGCNGLSAIELFIQIDFAISTPPSKKKISRDAIIEKVASLGLPAKLFEARAIASKIENELRYAPDARDEFPGLRLVFEHAKKANPKTNHKTIAKQYRRENPTIGKTVDQVHNRLKYCTSHNKWLGPKSQKPRGPKK
jgi:hypothetical protein